MEKESSSGWLQNNETDAASAAAIGTIFSQPVAPTLLHAAGKTAGTGSDLKFNCTIEYAIWPVVSEGCTAEQSAEGS